MIFTEIKLPKLSKAKGIAVSKKYLVFTTGTRALIFNREFQLLHEVTGLSYCYKACISPDEEKVLLISNGNKFYILSLLTYEIVRYTLKGKYKDYLDGNGCWSFDGSKILLCATQEKFKISSALRIYKINNMTTYCDKLCDKYYLSSVTPVGNFGKYLLTGFKYSNHKTYMIWYDGIDFEEYCIDDFEESVMHVEYDKENKEFILSGLDKTIVCDYYGNVKKEIPVEGSVNGSFSDVFSNCGLDDDKFGEIKELSKALGLEELSIPDSILCSCHLNNGKYICVGTHTSLLCLNIQNYEVLAKKKIQYGVHEIVEVNDNLILVSTWSGVKVFRIEL